MKKILCKVTALESNLSEEQLQRIGAPTVGKNIVVERHDLYSFSEGGTDGMRVMNSSWGTDKPDDNPSLYYVKLEQIAIVG